VHKNGNRIQYTIISGDPKLSVKRDEALDMCRHPRNAHGDIIKIIIATPFAGEGVDFRNLRQVHILEGFYHLSRVDQVVGRAIRYCSHVSLPVEERNATV